MVKNNLFNSFFPGSFRELQSLDLRLRFSQLPVLICKQNDTENRQNDTPNLRAKPLDRARIRTSDFILEPIELHLDRIRPVQ